MAYIADKNLDPLLVKARSALGVDNQGLAKIVKLSPRTISRWWANQSSPDSEDVIAIARAVYPVDDKLAAKLLAQVGTTLQALGIAPAPAPPAPPPPPPARPRPAPRSLVEAVVCAAAEAMQTPPDRVRPILRAAFASARGLGMTIEEVDDALAPTNAEAKRAPKK